MAEYKGAMAMGISNKPLIVLVFITILLVSSSIIFSAEDPRTLSNFSPIGRLEKDEPCTVTLIGKACAITAGHCLYYDDYIELDPPEYVEFNVPYSKNYVMQKSNPEDIYKIDQNFIWVNYFARYREFGVIRLKANKITGYMPGEIQGFYKTTLSRPAKGLAIRISGYGSSSDPTKHYSQTTDVGEIVSDESSSYPKYSGVETTSGNSGSAIMIKETREIIGVHTTGDALPEMGYGTYISGNQEFIEGIQECLEL